MSMFLARRAVRPVVVSSPFSYFESFDTDLAGWTGTGAITWSTALYYSGPASLSLTRPGGTTGVYYAEKVITGLTIGVSYTLSAYLMRSSTSVSTGTLRIEEIGGTATFTAASDTWALATYIFTATAVSHTIRLRANFIGTASFFADNVTVVQT